MRIPTKGTVVAGMSLLASLRAPAFSLARHTLLTYLVNREIFDEVGVGLVKI